ncbi:MAG: 4-amino-4-deoxy-L-arabinose transferase [Brevundimonas sp.]|uniref:ArnT family glycosyltransferase n=1 Tax=Brevundimonas sp. TaxID=1871086 RepID=UPI000DB27ADB|nr:glycosyltransferase family 39 protein [Brevundimonas sp.]PZT94587.1 MAG: 4-amino-4-deoxy-L-arabinose transferase [Brevundimonas sp.]
MKTFDLDSRIAGWRGPVLAALLTLIAGLPGLLLLPPLDRDESRFAQATSQMLESGDYVDIRYQDEPRWKKPVGIYWMQAAAVALTSDVEDREIAPYRIPSLLGAMLAAWAVAWAGAALLGSRVGFFGGAIMGATFLLSTEAGIAKTDAMLCGATTLAMAALARIYMATRAGERPERLHKFLFWAGLGLSILIKGPIGFLIVALTVVALSIWDRNVRWLYRLGWGWGLPLVALMVGPWAIAITIATDGGFWREAIGGDLAPKIAGAHESHSGFPGMYVLLAPLLFFPSTLLLPAAVSTGWSRRAEPAIRFLVCWLVPGWLMFELAPTKLWHYTLPTFGALALLAAAALARPIGKASRISGAVLAVFAAVLVIGVTIYGLTAYGTSTAQTWAALTVVMTLATGAGGAFLLLNRAPVAALVASLAFGITAHAALAGTIRQLRPLAVAPQLERTLEAADLHPRQGRTPGPVAITGYHEPSFVFLTGRETELTDAQGAAEALADGRPAIVEARDADAFRAAAARLGVSGRAVGVVDGYNYSAGDEVSLTVYAPPPRNGTANVDGAS